eukprot:CAMPEP_0113628384 /NCGR_PEP_ID=MMETSP0017_2-20120614/14706_1 /TAXON_ID=2856 /ORGANISM="Cylindrotheca closterium" /LENGTH=94 /DNA_ID=CAMNT_0000538685 /DNA_START=1528 /DNA_END=1809 /DNA_ORIENTATION=+ /assembly_acc=CAM_ASM_000147
MAPLRGAAYVTDNRKVDTMLRKFIVGNTEAEATLQAIDVENDGRASYGALRVYYEGEGINVIDIVEADNTPDKLCYNAEKPPNNTWSSFEQRLK